MSKIVCECRQGTRSKMEGKGKGRKRRRGAEMARRVASKLTIAMRQSYQQRSGGVDEQAGRSELSIT